MSDDKESSSLPVLEIPADIITLPKPSYYLNKKLTKREKIKIFIRALSSGHIIGTACRIAYLSQGTLQLWKRVSYKERLSKLIGLARDRGQEIRNDMVEDGQFRKLAMGLASGSEYEFYLTNRRTDRWKKINEFGSTSGAPVLLKPPVINYISVSVKVDKTGEVNQDTSNGNGNGRHLENV